MEKITIEQQLIDFGFKRIEKHNSLRNVYAKENIKITFPKGNPNYPEWLFMDNGEDEDLIHTFRGDESFEEVKEMIAIKH